MPEWYVKSSLQLSDVGVSHSLIIDKEAWLVSFPCADHLKCSYFPVPKVHFNEGNGKGSVFHRTLLNAVSSLGHTAGLASGLTAMLCGSACTHACPAWISPEALDLAAESSVSS